MTLLFEVKFEDDSLKDLQKYLKEIQSRIKLEDKEVREKLEKKLQEVMFDDLQKRFDSSPPTTTGGKVYGGVEWESLSDIYLIKRPDRKQGKVYIDSQDLQKSLTTDNPNNISSFEVLPDGDISFKFGTKLDYAEKLQKARPIVFMHKELIEKIVEIYEEFIIEEKE